MFILDLSFIGWYILNPLALGVVIFFVMPYGNTTNTELYLVLREEAIKTYESMMIYYYINPKELITLIFNNTKIKENISKKVLSDVS